MTEGKRLKVNALSLFCLGLFGGGSDVSPLTFSPPF